MVTLSACASTSNAIEYEHVTLFPEGHMTTAQLCSLPVNNSGPDVSDVTCSDGALNTVAWNLYVAEHDQLMELPRSASTSQVEHAACRLSGNITLSEIPQIYELVAIYNGWHQIPNVVTYIYDHCP
jgi:hypothetical protein